MTTNRTLVLAPFNVRLANEVNLTWVCRALNQALAVLSPGITVGTSYQARLTHEGASYGAGFRLLIEGDLPMARSLVNAILGAFGQSPSARLFTIE